jgi:hypothetical protein
MSPYEYHNNQLGVQGRFLFDGRNAHEQSLKLIGERGLQLKVQRGGIVKLRPQGPGFPMLVSYRTLPSAWRNLLAQSFGEPPVQARQTWCERLYERDTEAYSFYLAYSDSSGSLDDRKKTVETCTLNASVLNLVRKLYDRHCQYRQFLRQKVTGSSPAPSVRDSIASDIAQFRGVVPHTLPDNAARLFDRLRRYRKEGYGSLIHGNRCKGNARVVTTDVNKMLNDLFAEQKHKPTKAEIYDLYLGFLNRQVEVINSETGEIYNPEDFPKLSESTVRAYLSRWENKIATYAVRSGDRQKYMARFKPYHKLSQPELASSILSIDDRQPPFEYEKGRRPWFYLGIDVGSECFTSWVHDTRKEGIILKFYRQLVRNYAEWGFRLPAELECESSLNSSFRDSFLQPGAMFNYVRIEPNNARGKRIEGYFRQLRYNEKDGDGWISRPFALSEANQAGPEKVPIIPYNEIITRCLLKIQEWNNKPHSKIRDKTRWEVFCGMQNPNLPPTNYRSFIPHIGSKTETSCRTGIIRLQNAEFLLGRDGFIATGNTLIPLMERVEGRDIDVYWLDGNDRRVLKAYVYLKGQYICEAIAMPSYNRARIEQTPQDLANRELMSKYVSTIEGFGRRRRAELDRLTVIDHRDVCLNHKFVIPGLEELSGNRTREAEPAEVLEEAFEPDFKTCFKQDLMDVF